MRPFPLKNKSSVIVVNVLIKNKNNARLIKMVLDTGASISTIPSEIALAIGCDPAKPKRRIEMITASGIEFVPLILVPKISFLGMTVKNVEMACLTLPAQSGVSGLLGLNVLNNFDIHLLFRKALLMIE